MKKDGKDNYKVNSMLRSLKALFNYGIDIYDLQMKNPCTKLDFFSVVISTKYIPTDHEIEEVRNKLSVKQRILFDFVAETGARINEGVRFFNNPEINGDLITLWTRKSKNSDLTPRHIPKPDMLDSIDLEEMKNEWTTYPRFLEDLNKGKWNWHSLRHRIASKWANGGLTTLEIMNRLGHSSLKVTLNYLKLLGYTRL